MLKVFKTFIVRVIDNCYHIIMFTIISPGGGEGVFISPGPSIRQA